MRKLAQTLDLGLLNTEADYRFCKVFQNLVVQA